MSPIVVVVVVLAAFGLTLLLRKYEHTVPYVLFCAAFFVWCLVLTIMKANTGPTRLTVLWGLVTLFALWRTVTLAVQMKRARSKKPLP
jgi:hypothetical protein